MYIHSKINVGISSPQNGGRAAEVPPSGCYQKASEFGRAARCTKQTVRKIHYLSEPYFLFFFILKSMILTQ